MSQIEGSGAPFTEREKMIGVPAVLGIGVAVIALYAVNAPEPANIDRESGVRETSTEDRSEPLHELTLPERPEGVDGEDGRGTTRIGPLHRRR